MDERWLDEIHPDKIEMKLSGGFRFLLFYFVSYFECQISVVGLSLIAKIFHTRSLTTVANFFFVSELDFVTHCHFLTELS